MRILAYPHSLTLGGIQITAIQLAGAVRDLGHEVTVAAPPGPLEEMVADLGLPHVPVHVSGTRPSPRAIGALRALVRREGFEVVHAYARPACLEAYFGAHVLEGVPLVTTMMGFFVPRPFPRSVPLIVATRTLQEEASRSWNADVLLMEPPIDTDRDSPQVDGGDLAARLGLEDGVGNVVAVSRLARLVKLEGLERSIRAMEVLAPEMPARLVVVGGGEAEEHLRAMAEEVNGRVGRPAVVLTGQLLDPRPAYALADVVLGMGSSVLRGMSFGKPAIVLGEKGFSAIAGPDTVAPFLQHGFYGLGGGDLSPEPLAAQIRDLLGDEARRRDLGAWGRDLVCDRFSLRAAARMCERVYRTVAATDVPLRRKVPESLRIAAWATASRLKLRLRGAAL